MQKQMLASSANFLAEIRACQSVVGFPDTEQTGTGRLAFARASCSALTPIADGPMLLPVVILCSVDGGMSSPLRLLVMYFELAELSGDDVVIGTNCTPAGIADFRRSGPACQILLCAMLWS